MEGPEAVVGACGRVVVGFLWPLWQAAVAAVVPLAAGNEDLEAIWVPTVPEVSGNLPLSTAQPGPLLPWTPARDHKVMGGIGAPQNPRQPQRQGTAGQDSEG